MKHAGGKQILTHLLGFFGKPAVIALLAYFAVASIATFPFITNPHSTLAGPVVSDFSTSTVVYAAYAREGTSPFTAPRFTSIGQPDGIAGNVGVSRVSFLSVLYLWLGSMVMGSIMTHSVATFLGYLLTACITFLFVRAVTRSNRAAFVAGLIYGFSPLMLALGRAEPIYTHMWLYLLPIWAFWNLATREPDKRLVLLAAISIVPAVFWTPYYAFHILLVGASSLLVAAYYTQKKIGIAKTLALSGIIITSWVVVCAVYYLIGTTSSAGDVPVRTLNEAYQQSIQPLMLITPNVFSLWGRGLHELVAAHVPRVAPTSLYVGFSVLALAAVGFMRTLWCAKKSKSADKDDPLAIAVLICAAVVVCCFLFSLSPTIMVHGHQIPTPNYLVVKAVPALRAGQRLAMPLMGPLAALAGFGTYWVLRHYRNRSTYIALAVIVCIVGIDLWSPDSYSATRVTAAPSIVALKTLPPGRVAQYQTDSLLGYPAQATCLDQLTHLHPIVNDCGLGRLPSAPDTPQQNLAHLAALPICDQLPALRALSVRYVIISNDQHKVLRCFDRPSLPKKPILHDSVNQIFQL